MICIAGDLEYGSSYLCGHSIAYSGEPKTPLRGEQLHVFMHNIKRGPFSEILGPALINVSVQCVVVGGGGGKRPVRMPHLHTGDLSLSQK